MARQRQHQSFIFGIALRAVAVALAIAIVFALTVLATQSAQAQTFTVLHDFTRGKDGASPEVGLSIDGAGNLFGTANSGGSAGFGTVFELAQKGRSFGFRVLHSFTGGSVGSTDGGGPAARVVFGPNGTLYGSTTFGGNSNGGTVYNLGPAARLRTETILYSFTAGSDGDRPSGDLIFDQAGNIYGTTSFGGSTFNGTTFELTPSGSGFTEDLLYNFTGGNDGADPVAGVISDAAGNLYGTAGVGGAFGFGTVFELTGSGSSRTEQTLYSFQDASDGAIPNGGLIFDASGNLYGTTSSGGSGGGGTVFKLTPSAGSFTFSLLFSFTGRGGPGASLTMDAAGNLYGTTTNDGAFGQGSVFKLTPSGGSYTLTSLHDFTGGTDGGAPFSNVIFDAVGNLYGTASQGGANSAGVVFEITP